MRLTEVKLQDHDYVSKDAYDFDDPIEARNIFAGHFYTARLIVNKMCHEDFAADYFVKVREINSHVTPFLHPLVSQDLLRVTFLPCTFDGEVIRTPRVYGALLDESGELYNWAFDPEKVEIVRREQGYLVSEETDWLEEEWPDYTSKTTFDSSPLIPCSSR